MFKKILVGLVGLVVLGAGVGLALPSKWSVERSRTVKARAEHIVPVIADVRTWKEWTAWSAQRDPKAEWTFSGAPTGVGATMSWKGPELGFGTLTMTEVGPTRVAYSMSMEGNTPATGGFTLTPEADGTTRVTWKDEGDMGFDLMGRFFLPMIDSMLQKDFDAGLAGLAARAEAAQAQADAAAAAAAAPAEIAPLPAQTAADAK
jgi:hypothetical protein